MVGPRGFTTPNVDFESRRGVTYRITMQPPEGDAFHLSGEFRDVDPPARLVFTFLWEEPTPDDQETLVTLSLRDLGGSTLLTVDHGAFATEERLGLHQRGRTQTLERLEEVLSARHGAEE